MREIKFRVWDGETMTVLDEKQEKFQVVFGMKDGWSIWDSVEELYENDHTLLQYTGLKDKNGVEIFEGDIICCNHIKNNNRFTVVYDVCSFSFIRETDERYDYFELGSFDIEVIGNMHEHKHLLDKRHAD